MEKEEAKTLVPLRSVSRELALYAEYRQKIIMKDLVTASLEDIKGLQKSYQEIQRLKTLSDEIAKALGD